jgi:GNAT superfamily N-acetyltransferase
MSESVPLVQVRDDDTIDDDELVRLYRAVGWVAYTRDPESLVQAISNSTYVATARRKGQLIGLARGLSDDVSIFYLQDILVHPDHQRTGVGKALLARCLDRFSHVRGKVLLTDDRPEQLALYRSCGFENVADRNDLNAFVKPCGEDQSDAR